VKIYHKSKVVMPWYFNVGFEGRSPGRIPHKTDKSYNATISEIVGIRSPQAIGTQHVVPRLI
jgi:hypothetical protein